MVVDLMTGIAAAGFTALFASVLLLGLVEFLGKVYGTFRCLVREDLNSEQRVIYLLLVWLVPLGWLVYFLLGTARTRKLFSDIDFL